jgi:hypothetical protein
MYCIDVCVQKRCGSPIFPISLTDAPVVLTDYQGFHPRPVLLEIRIWAISYNAALSSQLIGTLSVVNSFPYSETQLLFLT